jgi:hypothetical protein
MGVEVTLDRSRFRQADAVVFHIPDLQWWWRPRKRRGQLWVAWSKECELHFPRFVEPRFMRWFDLKISYQRDADIPHTYIAEYLWAKSVTGEVLHDKRKTPLVASFISSGFDASGREKYVHELARHIAIDAYGRFMRNQHLGGDNGRPFKLATISRYKFTLAFENACRRDYVTEKFFEPLAAGSVPVYWGAANIEDYAPGDHCYINAADFAGPAQLASFIDSVGNDDGAYQAYFKWRHEPRRASFDELVATPHWFVILCDKLKTAVAQRRQPET